MSRINGDQRMPRVPSRADKVRVPVWMLLLAVVGKGLVLGVRWCWRHRIAVPVAVGLALFVRWFGPLGLVALLVGLAVVAVVWRRVHPRSFGPVARWVWGRARLAFVYRWRWRPAMVHTDLAIRTPTSNADQVTFDEYFPRIRGIRSTRAVDVLRVELLPGQTPEQWEEQAEALRHVFRARRCQVHAETHRFVRLYFHHRDTLTRPVQPADLDRPGPDAADPVGDAGTARDLLVAALGAVPVGRREDGKPWTLPVQGTHVLVAGATGAGKGSVLWSTIRGLGPAVRAGLVELWVCDPKGGMELAFGEPMFTRFATTTESIADLLDDAVTVMQHRTARLRDKTRLHTPTAGEPLIVLVVDEIASLTAYVTDRDVKKRIGAALPPDHRLRTDEQRRHRIRAHRPGATHPLGRLDRLRRPAAGNLAGRSSGMRRAIAPAAGEGPAGARQSRLPHHRSARYGPRRAWHAASGRSGPPSEAGSPGYGRPRAAARSPPHP